MAALLAALYFLKQDDVVELHSPLTMLIFQKTMLKHVWAIIMVELLSYFTYKYCPISWVKEGIDIKIISKCICKRQNKLCFEKMVWISYLFYIHVLWHENAKLSLSNQSLRVAVCAKGGKIQFRCYRRVGCVIWWTSTSKDNTSLIFELCFSFIDTSW